MLTLSKKVNFWSIKKYIIFFLYIKMTNNYYQKHKEKLHNKAHESYQNLSQEEKEKRRKKFLERYQNLSEKEKNKSDIIIMNVKKSF